MDANNFTVTYTLALIDQLTPAIRAAQQSLTGFGNQSAGALRASAAAGNAAASAFDSTRRAINKAQPELARYASWWASAAVLGGVKDLVDANVEFARSQNMVQAVSGATNAQMQELTKTALKLGGTTIFSPRQVMEGEVALAQAGEDVSQIQQSIGATATLAAAGQMSMSDASEEVVKTLSEFNLTASQANEVTNSLATGANASIASVTSLGVGLSYVGTTAHNLGVGLNTTTELLAVMANRGEKGSKSGTYLTDVMESLVDPTQKVNELFKEHNIQLSNYVDSAGHLHNLPQLFQAIGAAHINAAQILSAFGLRGGRGLLALSGASAEQWAQVEAAFDAVNGSGKAMAQTMTQGLPGALAHLEGAFDGLILSTGQSGFSSTLASVLNELADFLKWLQTAPPWLLKTAAYITLGVGALSLLAIGGMAAASALRGLMIIIWAGRAAMVAYGVVSAIVTGEMGALTAGTIAYRIAAVGATAVQWGLRMAMIATSLVMEATPIGWLITGLAAAALAVYELVEHWGQLENATFGAIEAAGQYFGLYKKMNSQTITASEESNLSPQALARLKKMGLEGATADTVHAKLHGMHHHVSGTIHVTTNGNATVSATTPRGQHVKIVGTQPNLSGLTPVSDLPT